MSDLFSAAEAISRIPGIEPAKARYRLLGGGRSNRSWLVEAEERKLVLRLDGPRAKELGLDRRRERAILARAGGQGVAPEVVFADADAGILVYEYLEGRCWTRADLEDGSNLEKLAALLRRVHALPRSGVPFDAAGAAARYVALIRGNEALLSFGQRCREIAEAVPVPARVACCHNDVVAANVVATPELRLLDWEYACDNEPLFDLASVIGYHDLDEPQKTSLLRAYAGSEDAERRALLNEQLRLFDALQWLWLAVREAADPRESQRARLAELARRITASA
ncbi:MAG TPA: choline/ethanolamine kinase family protein [Woeseiaceae bacterium]|nr:choline/ethanolamine kinase family protein [Woeseiaceae bacterium]